MASETGVDVPRGEARSKPWRALAREVDLPVPTAVWVLTAHVLTILSPLLVIAAVAAHRSFLDGVMDQPALLYASAVCLIVASVCESAQNTLDRWYLLGTPPSILDWCFNTLVVTSLALNVMAVYGDRLGVVVVAALGVVIYASLYLSGGPMFIAQGALGIASIACLYAALRDPVLVLSLVTTFLTLFFLDVLIRTRQQVMHGFVTGINAVGLLATVVAINNASRDQAWSWLLVVVVVAVVVAGAFALRPWLLRLSPTPRRQLSGGTAA